MLKEYHSEGEQYEDNHYEITRFHHSYPATDIWDQASETALTLSIPQVSTTKYQVSVIKGAVALIWCDSP